MDTKSAQGLVQGYTYLKYVHLKRLAPTLWLNDEIISEYINLINAKISETPNNRYIVFNSLKVKSLFEKTDHQRI